MIQHNAFEAHNVIFIWPSKMKFHLKIVLLKPPQSENTVRRFCLTEDTILKYLFLDSKNEDNGATSSEWVGMIFLKRRYSSEREEEFFFSCESGCEGEIENPKLLVFGGNKYYGQDDMARVIALHFIDHMVHIS